MVSRTGGTLSFPGLLHLWCWVLTVCLCLSSNEAKVVALLWNWGRCDVLWLL